MIEVVSFGDKNGRDVIKTVETSAIRAIQGGQDVMIHWGLQNDLLDRAQLGVIPSVSGGGGASKLARFTQVRALIASNIGAIPAGTLFPVFDSDFTGRLGL